MGLKYHKLLKDKNFVVEPNNPRELAEKILLVLGDDELLKKLSEDSRDLAEDYSWDKITEKTIRLYKSILSDVCIEVKLKNIFQIEVPNDK